MTQVYSMFSDNPILRKHCVLYAKEVDIKSIQKCPIDYECDFIPLENKMFSRRLGSTFVILQKDHFIAHIAGHTIKCDYNCRNRVMSVLSKYVNRGLLDDEKEIVENNFGLDLIDGVVHNNELPHLIFKLIDNVDGCFANWKAEDEALKLTKPANRVSNFHLVDYEGHPVQENTDYYLQMHDQPNDVLKLKKYGQRTIYATYHLNHANKIPVRYSIIDGIHYLTCENYYLQVYDHLGELGFKDTIPEKENRIEFHTTENNTFKTVRWDDDIWLALEKETFNYSSVTFNDNEAIVRWDKPLELILKRTYSRPSNGLMTSGSYSEEKCISIPGLIKSDDKAVQDRIS
ncbi:hypothetical protein BC943DRAFT_336533 [Umbelopsis sp. AD052]|nr:hypothetical protein BC943DRAFT_336533 [Umbelopsis sp. AD052]